jgi:hypothetical protein
MDPNACYRRIFESFANGDFQDAFDAIDDLRQWLANAGFEPEWENVPNGWTINTFSEPSTFGWAAGTHVVTEFIAPNGMTRREIGPLRCLERLIQNAS